MRLPISFAAIAIALAVARPGAAQMCVLSLSNPVEARVVSDFAKVLHEKRTAMGTNLLSAIDNFETTMQFASGFEAEPKVAEALLASALKQSTTYLVGLVDKKVPGTKQVVAAIQAVDAEIARAAKAKASHDVGAWIRQQRTLVSNHMTGANAGDLPTSVEIEGAILEDLCWIDGEGGDLEAAVEEIAVAQSELGPVPTEQTYRRLLFESWMRANFSSLGMKSERVAGTVHVFWEVEVDGDPNDYGGGPYPLEFVGDDWSAEVVLPGPYGDRVAGGFNELGVAPLEVRATKKICFETDGIAGGTATYCGALREDGSESSSPVAPWAAQALREPIWRKQTSTFRK